MYVDDYPSEGGARDQERALLSDIRVSGGLSIRVAASDGVSRIADLEERGGYRAKFPRISDSLDAVSINTGGGLVGGDDVTFSLDIGRGAAMTFATQSAERVYRALSDAVRSTVQIQIAPQGTLHWLPQETILFDGAKLDRTITADVAADTTLLMCESVVFGREAMGETVKTGSFRDRWQINRNGQPVLLEAISLDGDLQSQLQRKATGNGARAIATVLYVASDADERRDGARDALAGARGRAAVSAWNGMLVGRFLAPSAAALRQDLTALLSFLSRAPMPRVWNC